MPVQYSVSVTSHGEELAAQLDRGTEANLKAAAIIWHAGIIGLLRGTRSGYEYPVPGTGHVVDAEKTLPNGRTFYFRKLEGATYYTASAPGEPPATRTGDLRTSYRFRVRDGGAEVGSPLIYALHLEKGTENMAPRPAIEPAYRANKARIQQALERNVI